MSGSLREGAIFGWLVAESAAMQYWPRGKDEAKSGRVHLLENNAHKESEIHGRPRRQSRRVAIQVTVKYQIRSQQMRGALVALSVSHTGLFKNSKQRSGGVVAARFLLKLLGSIVLSLKDSFR